MLREARPGDLAACARIFLAVQPLAFPRQPAASHEATDFEAATREEELWVAEAAGGIRGWVAIYRPDGFIHHLYVEPGFHRQGIGSALLRLALRRCGGTGELKSNEANRAAHAFYMASGWRPAGWGWAPSGPWIRFRY